MTTENKPQYFVKYDHSPYCHPETCCCDTYHVVKSSTNKVIARFAYRGDAEKLVKELLG